jgi:hypothetical protein
MRGETNREHTLGHGNKLLLMLKEIGRENKRSYQIGESRYVEEYVVDQNTKPLKATFL